MCPEKVKGAVRTPEDEAYFKAHPHGGDPLAEAEGPSTDQGEEDVLLEPGDLPPFWQPTEKGDLRAGELRSVRKTKWGEALHLFTADGMIAVPISDAMSDVCFEKAIGRILTLVFTGFVETKAGRQLRTYRITAKKLKDVPF